MTIKPFLTLAQRHQKPRDHGITCLLDKGMGLRRTEDLLTSASDYVDVVKLGWGTAYIIQDLRDKIQLYRQAGVPVYLGGTLLELAILQNRFDEYRKMVQTLGLSHVEISSGIIELSIEEKVSYIKELKKDFVVLSEVGSKNPQTVLSPDQWMQSIQAELEAGAWKVICEARESGTVGLFHGNGEPKSALIDEITDCIESCRLIFEAPQKSQQVWFIRKFGGNVNLGNISPSEVIPLETLRLGLRGDTMPDFHDVKTWNLRSSFAAASSAPQTWPQSTDGTFQQA